MSDPCVDSGLREFFRDRLERSKKRVEDIIEVEEERARWARNKRYHR